MAYDFPSSPTTGQTFNVTGGPTYVWNGTAWVVLTPGNQFNRTVFTATVGQTTFTMNYVVGAIDVYRNGVKLVNTSDFTATNGTSIVLLNAASAGDTIEVISYPMITYTDAVKRTGDTMTGALAVPSLTVNSVPVLAGPAFNATLSANQSVSSGVVTKIQLNSELFDTANCFDSTSNYRFTPNVAGYYHINGRACGGTSSIISTYVYIYKNGVSVAQSGASVSVSSIIPTVSDIIYLNGTTDYVEMYAQVSATTPIFYSGVVFTNFSGALVRAS